MRQRSKKKSESRSDASGRTKGRRLSRLAGLFFSVALLYVGSVLLVSHRLVRIRSDGLLSVAAFFRESPQRIASRIGRSRAVDEGSPVSTVDASLPRVLAIYFPQYHRDPINDKNWGENFTDWNSLRGAPAQNRLGFPIPRPTDLGYYDLTQTNTRRHQRILAQRYGIDGFIYHHYWFYDPTHPGPNLAVPLLNMLQDGEPDIAFFFNWCAVKWINVWMGKAIFQTIPTSRNRAITLQEQYFNATQDMIRQHYQWLSPFFHHKNYIKVDGSPVFLLYFYDERAVPILQTLRELAKEDGFPGIHLVVGRSATPDDLYVPNNLTDRQVALMHRNLQPVSMFPMDVFDQSMTYPYPLEYLTTPYAVPEWCRTNNERNPPASGNKSRPEVTGVITTFDNTPRREYNTARMFPQTNPQDALRRFRDSLHATIYYHTCCIPQTNDRFVAVNAWNEWAEGMSLEPSDVYNHTLLQTIHDTKRRVREQGCSTPP